MPSIAMLDQAGKKVSDIELNDLVFGIEPNEHVVYDVIKANNAAKRQGTQKAKTRSEVRGGGRKPWAQKGTGRARQGSIRSPQWRGGGVVFAPVPRSYDLKVNRKVRRLGFKSVLSAKVSEEAMVVVNKIELDAIKTSSFVEIMNNLKTTGKKVLFIVDKNDDNVILSARNISNVTINTHDHVSAYDILHANTVVITEAAVRAYEEVLA